MGAIMCMGVATSNTILLVSFATEKMAAAGVTRWAPRWRRALRAFAPCS